MFADYGNANTEFSYTQDWIEEALMYSWEFLTELQTNLARENGGTGWKAPLRKTEVSVSRHLSKRKQLFDFFLDVKF